MLRQKRRVRLPCPLPPTPPPHLPGRRLVTTFFHSSIVVENISHWLASIWVNLCYCCPGVVNWLPCWWNMESLIGECTDRGGGWFTSLYPMGQKIGYLIMVTRCGKHQVTDLWVYWLGRGSVHFLVPPGTGDWLPHYNVGIVLKTSSHWLVSVRTGKGGQFTSLHPLGQEIGYIITIVTWIWKHQVTDWWVYWQGRGGVNSLLCTPWDRRLVTL